MSYTKFIGMLIVGLLLTGSFTGLLHAQTSVEPTLSTIKNHLGFSTPQIKNTGETSTITVMGTNAVKKQVGMPLIPVRNEIYTFPFGTRIEEVVIEVGSIMTQRIDSLLEPSPVPLPYDASVIDSSPLLTHLLRQKTTYDFEGVYPESWVEYDVKVGLDEDNNRKTFVIVQTCPVRYDHENHIITSATDITVDIRYTYTEPKESSDETYDLLIISADAYLDELASFVTHKTDMGIATNLVSVSDIDTEGRDQAEQIKYFIKQAIEQWDITSVLLVGGHRSFLGFNQPKLQIPLRFVDLDDTGEPGYVSDVYYSDIYAYDDGVVFSSWDTDNDGRYGEWYYISDDVTDKQDEVDLIPDVHLGRWACRTENEAAIMVDKVITYETTSYSEEDWFKKMIVLTGDDFQDQLMLDIAWDTTNLSGTYTIHAVSTNQNDEESMEDTVMVTVDHTQSSVVSFSENDHETTDLKYPHIPVAEITVPSEGNILGSTDVYDENPPNAYIGYRWTPVNYTDNIIKIQGKSYNPQPHTETPINTTLSVWITDESDTIVFGPVEKELGMYFEGEWATQKAIDFMPDGFDVVKLWTSMGTFRGSDEDVHDAIDSVVSSLSQGSGFMYIAGHANPMVFANHYPGIPGGRSNGDVVGLTQFNPFRGYSPSRMFPLSNLDNDEKQPILVLSGCHPCQLDVSFLRLLSEKKFAIWYGTYVWESLGWWLTRLEGGGAIATLGPTGLGYGGVGPWGTKALGGWLWPEFFRQYSEEGKTIIGEAWTQALKNYIMEFGPDLDLFDTKTVEEMVLLGDPTLQIG